MECDQGHSRHCGFHVVDLAFFSSNMFRIVEGGWVPLAVGGVMFVVMSRGSAAATL